MALMPPGTVINLKPGEWSSVFFISKDSGIMQAGAVTAAPSSKDVKITGRRASVLLIDDPYDQFSTAHPGCVVEAPFDSFANMP